MDHIKIERLLINYKTLEKFKRGDLDYTFQKNSRETEIWGHPHNVTRFIDAVNDSCVQWLKDYPGIVSVPMHLFPAQKQQFADVCHFTTAGMDTLASIVNHSLGADTTVAGQMPAY